jgi:phage gpG-like protein
MAIELQIKWAGRSADDFARQFQVAANVKNFKPALTIIAGTVIAPSVRQNFESGGRPQWAPLAATTVEKKARQGAANPSKILVHSGAMAEAAANSKAYQITNDTLKAAPFATRYWIYHQVGTGHVPQRVMMSLQAADRTKVNTIFANYMRQFIEFNPKKPGGREFVGGGL